MTSPVAPEDELAGAELRALRKKKKLSQAELGERTGFDRETINKLESGKRKLSRHYAEPIAEELGVETDRLLPKKAAVVDVRSPLDRLAALEALVAARRDSSDSFAEELLARLDALEAVVGIEAPPSSRPEKGGLE